MMNMADQQPGLQPGQQPDDGKAPLLPLLNPAMLGKKRITEFATGTREYCLKCTKGIFQGRYLYPSAAGELFGSDADNPNITMLIENAQLVCSNYFEISMIFVSSSQEKGKV